MKEFERMNQTIGRKAVAITSWFDEGNQRWRASAPGFSHLAELSAAVQPQAGSRKAAIDWVVTHVTRHIDGQTNPDKQTIPTMGHR